MEETLFYVFGIALVLSALALSAVGLRSERFPPSRIVLAGVVAYFVVLVGATATFAVLNAREQQRKRDAEHAEETAATEPAPGETTTTGATTTTTETTGGAPQGKPTTLNLAADTNAIAFDTTQLSGAAGQVTIDFDNPSAVSHDVCIESSGQEIGCSDTIAQAKTPLSENLKPGSYTFYCSVDGHRQAGMEGTLTIK